MAVRWVSSQQVASLLGPEGFSSPVYRDLAERVRLLVVDGRLGVGVRMPSERDFAESLRLSRSTVAAAYLQLREQGYLRARPGSGNFVAIPDGESGSLPLSAVTPDGGGDGTISFAFASAAAPPGLGDVFRSAADRLPTLLHTHGYLPDGLFALRSALADWYSERGLATTPDQLIITAGALSALNIVAATVLAPGDRALLESPTYPNAINVLNRAARTVPYPLPPSGWEPRDFELTLRQALPRISYLIPDFHNPTGAWLDEETRPQVAAALHRYHSIAVIDETLVETGLEAEPLRTPLASYLPDAVTIGSASKAFWGGLRIGWIRAPRDLVRPLIETRSLMDLGAPPLEQLVLTQLLTDGTAILSAHRDRLREQRDLLLDALAVQLPEWAVTRPPGGLALWVTLPQESSSRLAAQADRHGLVLTAGPRFFVGAGGERHLRLPYTAETSRLAEAVPRLSRLWSQVADTSSPGYPAIPFDLTA